MSRAAIDWEAVEREYRAGLKTLRQIGDEYGCSHVAVKKRAEREKWPRDLSAKITAAAEAKVTKAMVTKEVTKEAMETERAMVEASATVIADAVINQRYDIKRARATVQKLWSMVDVELDSPEEMAKVGEILRTPNAFGEDKLNDLYLAAIGLPQQIKNAKLLADAIKVLIELERKVLRIDEQKPVETDPLRDLLNSLGGKVLGPARDAGFEDEQ